MSRIINGVLFVASYDPTSNPGEYTFTNAEFNNQADMTGAGAGDIQVGFILYVPAADINTFMPIPGVSHRYKIVSIQSQDVTYISATILWDEAGVEMDTPISGDYAFITESTPVSYTHLTLPTIYSV